MLPSVEASEDSVRGKIVNVPPQPKTMSDALLSEMRKQTKCLEQVRDAAVLVKWLILLAIIGVVIVLPVYRVLTRSLP